MTPNAAPPDADLEALRHHRVLDSGKWFRYDCQASGPAWSYTSADGGRTWRRGGGLMPYRGPIQGLHNVAIQMGAGRFRGRIVIPFYFQMDGLHPDYTRPQRGGYALYKGRTILLESHTHTPEMAGSFMVYSDDEGDTWCTSRGFLMGYFDDGHQGFTPGDEPVVAELSDGRLLCHMRSTCGRLVRSFSSDGAESWTKVEPTDLASSNSPCALAVVPGTHDLVLIWNQVSADEIERGFRRGRLSIALSHDDGRTWDRVRTLERVSGLSTVDRVPAPPLCAMVRGPSGPDRLLGRIPDDFHHYGYPEIFFGDDRILIAYKVHEPSRPLPLRWRSFPIRWLYEAEGG